MKLAFATVLIASIAAPVFAQHDPSSPPAKAPAPAAPPAPAADKPKDVQPDPKAVKDAEALMAEVAKVYKNAKTISDTIKIAYETPMGSQTQEFKVAAGPGDDAFFGFSGMAMTSVNGKFYVVREDVSDKFVQMDAEKGGIGQSIKTVFGTESPMPLHFSLRSNDKLEEQLRDISMAMLQSPKIVGHQMAKTDDGAAAHEIMVTGDGGKGSIFVNPESKLIKQVNLNVSPQEGIDIKVNMTMSPVLADTLATPIAFNAGDRKAVKSMDELEPTPIAEGESAPDFTLQTLEGESVTLSKLQGSVVVLDFWATWCGPCKMALPKFNDFAKWVTESKAQVKVYAVDVFERTKNADETKTKVGDFWKSKSYSFPTLLDLDNKVVGKYGFSSIPTTVIVGPTGKVFKIHSGFNENMVEDLKTDVENASKTTG